MADRLDTYTHGHHESVLAQHRKRTAAEAAGFLLAHLRSGMRLLDVGCGPGSITIGLADAVAPGEVLAIDLARDAVMNARVLATERGISSVRFARADVEALPAPDRRFDVVYAHQVLQHLARPVHALREMKRVLEPGGLVAVRDADYGSCTWSPPDAHVTRWSDIYHAVSRRNGGEPDAGRYLFRWLLDAGFADVQVGGTVWTFPGHDTVESWATSWAERTVSSNVATKAVEYGIATREELRAVADGLRRWGGDPAAFFSIGHVHAIGRKS